MYLNIVNNLSFEKKKNRSSISEKQTKEKKEEDIINHHIYREYQDIYNSIFYGQLTKNWLTITN
tara:strand:+ start:144 stop:335 length:192 start_codon:yes stop_codon:yes gene_type:complete